MTHFDILFFDLDNTLLMPDHATVSDRNRAALAAAQAKGVKLVIATGRCLSMIPPAVREIDFDYAVTSNGTAIDDLKAGRRIFLHSFTREEARIACEAAERNVDFYELFADGLIRLTDQSYAKRRARPLPPWHVKYFAEHTEPSLGTLAEYLDAGAPGLEKVNMNMCDPAALASLREEIEPAGLFEITTYSGATALEIVPRGCSKGACIRRLCKRLGVDIARSAAFGDGGNDVEMLRTAGCGVAMGNAADAAKAAARRITAPYDEDGVAQFIEEYI